MARNPRRGPMEGRRGQGQIYAPPNRRGYPPSAGKITRASSEGNQSRSEENRSESPRAGKVLSSDRISLSQVANGNTDAVRATIHAEGLIDRARPYLISSDT